MPVRLSLLEWILFGLVVLLLLLVAVQAFQLHAARASRDQLKAEAVTWASANASNQHAIAQLTDANERWAAVAQDARERGAAAVASLLARSSDLERQLSATRSDLEALYARDPKARAWRDRPVPAAVADRVLEGAHR